MWKNILCLRKVVLSIFLLTSSGLHATDVNKLGYQIDGENYLPTTYKELSDAKSFWSSKSSRFFKKNVVFLASVGHCNRLDSLSVEDGDHEPKAIRQGWKYIFIKPPEGTIFSQWPAYLTDIYQKNNFQHEMEKCRIKKNEVEAGVFNDPQFYVWGTVMQGQFKSGRYGEEWLDLHGLAFADGFGDNAYLPDASTVIRIAAAVWRAKSR